MVRALNDRPTLLPDLIQDMQAFWDLNLSRPEGLSAIRAIPLTEIESYMNIWNITGMHERVFFMRRIRLMDSILMKVANETKGSKENARD